MTPSAASHEREPAPARGGDHVNVGLFRSQTWVALAALLRASPDEPLLEQLRALAAVAGGEDAGEPADGTLGSAWSGLADATRGADLARLDDEFHDLFIGIGRGELVPYASWYRTGFLMDRPLVGLRRDLQLLGFEREAAVREPEDHAAALAEVMSLLSDPGEGQDDSTQRLFFEEHVGTWMDAFFRDLERAGSADFYRAVGRLGAAFVAFERDWLGAEPASTAAAANGALPR